MAAVAEVVAVAVTICRRYCCRSLSVARLYLHHRYFRRLRLLVAVVVVVVVVAAMF
jgi:hypothetical protein